jgi:hypothetical protein
MPICADAVVKLQMSRVAVLGYCSGEVPAHSSLSDWPRQMQHCASLGYHLWLATAVVASATTQSPLSDWPCDE